jgi:peroxiredoxin
MTTSLQAITAKLVQQLQQQGGQTPRLQQQLQQQLQQFQQQAGNVKVYTGPKEGKFIINKHGKKVYIDRKSLANNLQYQKAAKPKAKKARAAKKPKA